MPKLSYQLKDFSGGVMTNADESDVSDNAAISSLNISPISKFGAAESIDGHTELIKGLSSISSFSIHANHKENSYDFAANIP